MSLFLFRDESRDVLSPVAGAVFSPCRVWRYRLWRTWDENRRPVMFVGLNPSTADETKNDPTIRRCIRFAKDWGYGGLLMGNLFAFRATDPKDMMATADPVGAENDAHLIDMARSAGRVVCAWGTKGNHRDRDLAFGHLIRAARVDHQNVVCLSLTKHGHPGHPLYIPADVTPIPYPF